MIHDTDLITTIERDKLIRLGDSLLRLRDFIQDLENCMTLLDLSLEGNATADNVVFLQFLINLITNEFPPTDCQYFKESIDSTRNLVRECLGLEPLKAIEQLVDN